jgi:hypothetical protein
MALIVGAGALPTDAVLPPGGTAALAFVGQPAGPGGAWPVSLPRQSTGVCVHSPPDAPVAGRQELDLGH